MAGKMSRRGRYQKCADAILEARETGNPQKIKDSYKYLIGVAKQFPTVDGLASLLHFWFTEIDNQPWLVDIIVEQYEQSGKYKVQELDENEVPRPARKLVLKKRIT
jgi:hypothetical protein